MEEPPSRRLRYLFAALLLVLVTAQAARLAEQVRSDTHESHTLIRAHAPRLAAGRVAPDLADSALLPAPGVDPGVAAPCSPAPRTRARCAAPPARSLAGPARPRAPPAA